MDTKEEETSYKIWIGNLDSRLTEFQVVQVLKTFGHLANFEFLFHGAGPNKGLPRGYCFVEYKDKEAAERAISSLNGQEFASKKWKVGWAHDSEAPGTISKGHKAAVPKVKALPQKAEEQTRDKKMAALEAKLRLLEGAAKSSDFSRVSKHPVLARQENDQSRPHPYKGKHRRPVRR